MVTPATDHDWTESLAGLARSTGEPFGVAPTALLRARPIPDAQEVLICTFTSDLRFFESMCLPEARAMRARVTILRDVNHGIPFAEAHQSGAHYTDVPVQCRSGGAFHPKIVVIAGADRAVVAIGSGNLTTAGWHHNAELWTVLAATAADWPDTFTEIADWLRRLPRRLHVDPFGASRIREVASLLAAHPPRAIGPRLVHNLDRRIVEVIPELKPSQVGKSGADELGMASPFLDPAGAALIEVTRRLAPATATLALTVNAVGTAGPLIRWASDQHRVAQIADRRYHHGKLVEWRTGAVRTALVGSANLTAAAMLMPAGQAGANCELGLLLQTEDTLLPTIAEGSVDDPHLLVATPVERQPAAPAVRLLRVLTDGATTTVHLLAPLGGPGAGKSAAPGAASGPPTDAILHTATRSAPLIPAAANLDGTKHVDPAIWTLEADVGVTAASLCTVQFADGSTCGPIPATDATAVVLRPGTASPLEDTTLAHVLNDAALSQRLFEALAELALLRQPTDPDSHDNAKRATSVQISWLASAERIAGPALVSLAIGSRADFKSPTDANREAGVDTALAPGESSAKRRDRPAGGPSRQFSGALGAKFDGQTGDGWQELDVDDGYAEETDEDLQLTAVTDAWTPASDPVSLLRDNVLTSARLARRINRLVAALDDWSLPALLVLVKITLITAAGGGWPSHGQTDPGWADVLADVLARLASGAEAIPVTLDDSRHAAATVGLAALATCVTDWDRSSPARTRFDRTRDLLDLDLVRLGGEQLEDRLIEHYAADLHRGLGPHLTPAAIRDAAPFLLDNPLVRLVEDLRDRHPTARLLAPRLIAVDAPHARPTVLLRLLNRCDSYAPVAVRIHTSVGNLLGVWQPKTLTVQHDFGRMQRGAKYHLTLGPGAHPDGALPRPVTNWSGPLPVDTAGRFRALGLLDDPQ